MTVNSEEHHDQKRNQDYYDPRAMHKLGEDENHQHHKGGNRADSIYHQIFFPMRFPLELLDLRRSEEHTSELQSQSNLVCRLLLEKKNNNTWRAKAMRSPH